MKNLGFQQHANGFSRLSYCANPASDVQLTPGRVNFEMCPQCQGFTITTDLGEPACQVLHKQRFGDSEPENVVQPDRRRCLLDLQRALKRPRTGRLNLQMATVSGKREKADAFAADPQTTLARPFIEPTTTSAANPNEAVSATVHLSALPVGEGTAMRLFFCHHMG
jgi:hypothetical protein